MRWRVKNYAPFCQLNSTCAYIRSSYCGTRQLVRVSSAQSRSHPAGTAVQAPLASMPALHGTVRVPATTHALQHVLHPGSAPAATPLMGFRRSPLPTSRRTSRPVVRRVASEHQEAARPQLKSMSQVGVPRKRLLRTVLCGRQTVTADAAQDLDDDEVPYLDGFLRSFLLGLAMGGVFETLHVVIKVGGVRQLERTHTYNHDHSWSAPFKRPDRSPACPQRWPPLSTSLHRCLCKTTSPHCTPIAAYGCITD